MGGKVYNFGLNLEFEMYYPTQEEFFLSSNQCAQNNDDKWILYHVDTMWEKFSRQDKNMLEPLSDTSKEAVNKAKLKWLQENEAFPLLPSHLPFLSYFDKHFHRLTARVSFIDNLQQKLQAQRVKHLLNEIKTENSNSKLYKIQYCTYF